MVSYSMHASASSSPACILAKDAGLFIRHHQEVSPDCGRDDATNHTVILVAILSEQVVFQLQVIQD